MPPKYRIVATVRAKNEAWILETWLKRTSEFVDGIIALDDGSTDSSSTILKSHPKVMQLIQKPAGGYWDEHRDRNTLLDAVRSLNSQWCLITDPDEIMDERLIGRLDQILGERDSSWHRFREITLWKGTTHHRIDHPEKYQRYGASVHGIIRLTPQLKWVRREQYTWKQRLLRALRSRRWQYVPNVGSEKLIGMGSPPTIHEDLVKVHYHFADWNRAWRAETRIAVYRAISTRIRLNEVQSLVDEMAHRLDETGLQVAPVDPVWGVLPLPLDHQ